MEDILVEPIIYVNMLGEFSITIQDRQVNNQHNRSKKVWGLLEYLITFRDRKIPASELIDLIWSEDDSSNPSGALKTLMFRARQLLTPLDYPPQELILQTQGCYTWNSEITTIVDTDIFEDLCNKALSDNISPKQQLDFCLRAVRLYKGDFLSKSSWEFWIVSISTFYHSLYIKVASKALDLLALTEDYEQIIQICHQTIIIEPFNESFHYSLIFALYQSGNQCGAIQQYNRTIEMFYHEFLITPSERLKTLYKLIQDKTHGITTDLSLIQEGFLEESHHRGAFCCEYAVFKDIYQLECRAIERTGDSIFLCLMTLSDEAGRLPKTPILITAMDMLGNSICNSLRRGDVYSRYSISQFMILLPTYTYENAEMVLKRIIQNFRKCYTRKNIIVSPSLQAIKPC